MEVQVRLDGVDVPKGPFRPQLLKWVGNKQRFAQEIISYFPDRYERYFEPFLGSGGDLASLRPSRSLGSDALAPLIEIWSCLRDDPEKLKVWYAERWSELKAGNKKKQYEAIRDRYNRAPTGADLLILSRSCYGGVVRFRHANGHMSTPCGVHDPIAPEAFSYRVDLWHARVRRSTFECLHYTEAMAKASKGDLIYCDPPYAHSQAILYKSQRFSLENLFRVIGDCRDRGVYVALSIDGTKKSGNTLLDVKIPKGLFKREIAINCGRSMLRRFQLEGQTLEREIVTDRLLLTY